jgi:hypothetical protein
MGFFSKTVPLAVTHAYRLIPVEMRAKLPGNGTSTAALAAIRAGGGWAAFWWYALPRNSAGRASLGGAWVVPQGSVGHDYMWFS